MGMCAPSAGGENRVSNIFFPQQRSKCSISKISGFFDFSRFGRAPVFFFLWKISVRTARARSFAVFRGPFSITVLKSIPAVEGLIQKNRSLALAQHSQHKQKQFRTESEQQNSKDTGQPYLFFPE